MAPKEATTLPKNLAYCILILAIKTVSVLYHSDNKQEGK